MLRPHLERLSGAIPDSAITYSRLLSSSGVVIQITKESLMKRIQKRIVKWGRSG